VQVKFAQEFLISCRDEAQVLIQQHWQEIAMHKSKIKLNPNWDAYEALEASGQLSIFTARLKGKLVGYFVTITRQIRIIKITSLLQMTCFIYRQSRGVDGLAWV